MSGAADPPGLSPRPGAGVQPGAPSVRLPANPLSKKHTVGFDAKGTIERSDFGVKDDVPRIGDALHLTIAGAFERAECAVRPREAAGRGH